MAPEWKEGQAGWGGGLIAREDPTENKHWKKRVTFIKVRGSSINQGMRGEGEEGKGWRTHTNRDGGEMPLFVTAPIEHQSMPRSRLSACLFSPHQGYSTEEKVVAQVSKQIKDMGAKKVRREGE